MKLFEIAKPPVDWNTKSEKQQIAMVKRTKRGVGILKIANPSEAVQMASVLNSAGSLRFIEQPSEAVQLAAIKNNQFAI